MITLLNPTVIFRFLEAILSSLIIFTTFKIYVKTSHRNYLVIVLSFTILAIGSTLEVLAITAPTKIQSLQLYMYTAVAYTLTYAFMIIFLALTFDEKIREIAFILIGGFSSLELFETIRNPIELTNINGLWILESARSETAYLSRSLMMLIIVFVFSIYLFDYIKRTLNKKRKLYAITLITISFLSIIVNGIYLLTESLSNNPINQVFASTFGFLFSLVLWAIIWLDPYMFVFFRGKVNILLVYRDDGVLLSEIPLQKKLDLSYSLIASFITAVSEFGREVIYGKQNLDHINFEEERVFIVPYKNIYAAIVGEGLNPEMKGFVREFLRAFYEEFEDYINSDVLIIPDEKRVYELFMQSLGRVIL